MFKWYAIPDAMDFDGWKVWREETRRRHPVQYFFRFTLRILLYRWYRRLIHKPCYWLKCRLWHRYNVVVCRSLPPTWVDRDYLLLHAAFQILEDFIEKEEPWEFKATEEHLRESYADCGPDERVAAWLEIQDLYRWWKQRKDDESVDYDDQDWRAVDDAKLHRLIDLRGYFWT
jgi:hypothetical protein